MRCETVVIIGASTGGPQTLRKLLSRFPMMDACVLIVQHMPKHVNLSIARSLNAVTEMNVALAEDQSPLRNGWVLIAPSEVHMEIEENRRIRLVPGEKVNYVCPSIDVTMNSVKGDPRINWIGVILTGMGSDGARGLAHMKAQGGIVMAQDEASCVIYGMPRAAVEIGKVDFVLPPEMIGDKIVELVNSRKTS